jgi:wyosine [tRNA(Phe)-imidazoG37] synthetase (radical SAM superfamily)
LQCNILKNFYVKSNGDIRCDDDYGERQLLGKLSQSEVFIPKVFFYNANYMAIRKGHSTNVPPWGETCEKCVFYRSGQSEDMIASKSITKIQLEPSLLCSLACPGCSRVAQIKAGRKPLIMSEQILDNLLTGLLEEDYSVDRFELCGQGEPLNHPVIDKLIKLINIAYPNSDVSLVTNGNFNLEKKLIEGNLTEIIVSVDGAYQESYEKYRINGNIEQSIRFMDDARKKYPKARIIWKYVLFTHNDSDDEIITAQRIADKIQVDELRFINTSYGPASQRLSKALITPFPIQSIRTTIFKHPLIPGTLKVLNIEANSRLWLNKVVKVLGARFVNKFWPSLNHRIEKVSIIKQEENYCLFIDGWASTKKSVTLTYLGESKPIQRIFSNPHLSLWQNFLGALHKKIRPSLKFTGFRESFSLDTEILPSFIEIKLKSKGRFLSSTFNYTCEYKQPDKTEIFKQRL